MLKRCADQADRDFLEQLFTLFFLSYVIRVNGLGYFTMAGCQRTSCVKNCILLLHVCCFLK
ncbi:MAG TPA: hypothetical protein DCM26_00215 [Desulfotomaculum sp.]|nr:hypothetical protein [Desulfotomaculum sp.]